MPLAPRIARPLMAPIFVHSGITALQSPELLSPRVEPFTAKMAGTFPGLPKDAPTQVRINGAAQVVGGVLVGLGKFRRLGALILIGSLIPTTWAAHAFWKEEDPATRAAERIQLEKNLAIFGALLMVLAEPRKRRRKDRQAAKIGAAVEAARSGKGGKKLSGKRGRGGNSSRRAVAGAGDAGHRAVARLGDVGQQAVARAGDVGQHAVARAGDVGQHAVARAGDVGQRAAAGAGGAGQRAVARTLESLPLGGH